uniref:FAM194 C-terminal domain-containing protein n=1 Tax=Paramormyrops kingsleyae TaxID=1676925 RepID=A0A3B3SZW2_9TELE
MRGRKEHNLKAALAAAEPSVDARQTDGLQVKTKNRKTAEKLREEIVLESPCLQNKQTNAKAHSSESTEVPTTISFSISSALCSDQGWLIYPEPPPRDDPDWQAQCQWVVERLQPVVKAIKEQTAELKERGLTKSLVLRHYGDDRKRAVVGCRRGGVSFSGPPPLPQIVQEEPSLPKLHYRTDDGTSFIYYPSGRVAVCQTPSGLLCGGFYTNVFGDTPEQDVLATFTALGCGSVTHPLSGTVMATWNQRGGFMCDPNGAVKKEWIWGLRTSSNDPIRIQVTELISLRVRSPASATLWFRGPQESVQLSITPPSGVKSLVAVRPAEGVTTEVTNCQMNRVAQRGGQMEQELRRLRRRAGSIVDCWLEHYRVTVGLKVSESPCRTLLKQQLPSAALTSISAAGTEVPYSEQPLGGSAEGHMTTHHQSAPANSIRWDLPICTPLARLLLTPRSPEMPRPSPVLPDLSVPCPSLLRATLLGHEGCRLCPCSAHRMPLLTDLEYDAFVSSQALRRQQILIVYVAAAQNPWSASAEAALEEMYRRRNKNRSMPCAQVQLHPFKQPDHLLESDSSFAYSNEVVRLQCSCVTALLACILRGKILVFFTCLALHSVVYASPHVKYTATLTRTLLLQCYLDPFRMVKYTTHATDSPSVSQPSLLQQRHNVAPGMIMMYIGGKLLFADYITDDGRCSSEDLQKQMARTLEAYRRGHCLPPDYRFSPQVGRPRGRGCQSYYAGAGSGPGRGSDSARE